MNTKLKPETTEARHERDLATFERLPEKTKKLMKLKDQNEKTSGPQRVRPTRTNPSPKERKS